MQVFFQKILYTWRLKKNAYLSTFFVCSQRGVHRFAVKMHALLSFFPQPVLLVFLPSVFLNMK